MRKFCIALCGGIVLTGCSSFSERHQASGNFEYLDETQRQAIVVPQGFTPFKTNKRFDIPALGSKVDTSLVGAQLDIRAPALIMSVARNSLVDENSNNVEVTFESFMAADAFRSDMWQKLNHFVGDEGYGIGSSIEGNNLVTREIKSAPYFKILFGFDEDYSLAQQYQFSLKVPQKGQKAVVSVTLINHMEQGEIVSINQFSKRRYEARMLNQFLSHVYLQDNKRILANRVKSDKGLKIELGFDSEQRTIYKIHASFELAWEKLATVLPQLGFEVVDR
ncbi:MAG: outer membrane protein assembly factor BamC, partial [Psychrobium sp.]|nr:outer membrane protein assembly factor BamC [Psychrobium sp.]